MLSARPAKPVLEAFVDWPAIIEEFEVGMGCILVGSLSGMLAGYSSYDSLRIPHRHKSFFL